MERLFLAVCAASAPDPGRRKKGRRPREDFPGKAGVEPNPMPAIDRVPHLVAEISSHKATSEFTIKLTPFDQRQYRKLIAARAETIRRVVGKLKPVVRLESALDAG